MQTFGEALTAWIPFFALLGGAVATLIGLLFVAVSINIKVIMKRPVTRAQAILTFNSFVFLLEISIYALVPQQNQFAFGATLTIFALFNLGVGLQQIIPVRRILTRSQINSAALTILPLLIAAGSGVLIYFGDASMLYVLLAAVITILIASVSAAWSLLVEVGTEDNEAGAPA